MTMLKKIASTNYLIISKDIAKIFGNDVALLLSELAGWHDFFKNNEGLIDGWFYLSVKKVEQNINLTQYQQKKALDELQKFGVVQTKNSGVPARRMLKINERILENLIQAIKKIENKNLKKCVLKNLIASDQKTLNQGQKTLMLAIKKLKRNYYRLEESITNKEKYITNKEKEKEKKEKEKKQKEKKLNMGEKPKNTEIKPGFKGTASTGTDNEVGTNAVNSVVNKQKQGQKKQLEANLHSLIETYTSNENLRELLKNHLDIRKQKKAAYTEHAVKLSLEHLNELAVLDKEKIQIVKNSIMSGWVGFFPLKEDEKKKLKNAPVSASDYAPFDYFTEEEMHND